MLSYLSKSIAPGPHQSSRHSTAISKDKSPSMDEESAHSAQHKQDELPERDALKRQITTLFKAVWDGLYQTHEGKGPFRTDEIQTLYRGAGMSSYPISKESFSGLDGDGDKGDDDNDNNKEGAPTKKNWRSRAPYPLVPLTSVLSKGYPSRLDNPSVGLQSALDGLKVWEESSLESLARIVEVLKAYEGEIAVVDSAYAFLREKQVGLREPTAADERAVVEGLKGLGLVGCGRRLKHYGARMGVLGMEMQEEVREVVRARNEAIEEENEREGRRGKGKKLVDVEGVLRGGVAVRETVYPRMRMKGSGWISGSVVGSGGW
jgi:hypothetical protein